MARNIDKNWDQDACESCVKPESTMEDCHTLTIESLTSRKSIIEVSEKLISFKTNYEKMIYTYRVLRSVGLFPYIRKNPKDDLVAVTYRNEGNAYFKHNKHYEALQCYNLSLLYAVPETEHMVLAVSNRSAVLFRMDLYEECLQDIQFVFKTEYPEKIREKLLERRKKCLEKIESLKSKQKDPNESIIADIMSLKGPRDKKYISASGKLKVVHTKEMGRHVIANEDIQVGEVLVQEDPYLTVLLKNQFLFCCGFCLSRKWNLYPCLTCTYTLYCSLECRNAAEKQYHSVECIMMPALVGLEFSKLEWLAVRTVLRSWTDSASWDDAIKTADIAESRANTGLWGCTKVGNDWIYDSKYYSSIHTLATNVEKRSVAEMFRKCLTASVLFRFFAMVGLMKFTNVETLERVKKYVGSTLMTHLMTSSTNMHSISTNTQNGDGDYVEELNIACGAYAFLSLINHSCAPNVVRYSKLGTAQMSLIAIRPIKKGMQIFDNYGFHHAIETRQSRQSNLQYQYKFICACEACVHDWPMHSDLKPAKDAPADILKKKDEVLSSAVLAKLMKADKDTAVESYRPLCELIEVFDAFAPCKELADCQEALKQCLVIFQGVVPFMKEIVWRSSPPCRATKRPHHIEFFLGPIPGFDEYMD